MYNRINGMKYLLRFRRFFTNRSPTILSKQPEQKQLDPNTMSPTLDLSRQSPFSKYLAFIDLKYRQEDNRISKFEPIRITNEITTRIEKNIYVDNIS